MAARHVDAGDDADAQVLKPGFGLDQAQDLVAIATRQVHIDQQQVEQIVFGDTGHHVHRLARVLEGPALHLFAIKGQHKDFEVAINCRRRSTPSEQAA